MPKITNSTKPPLRWISKAEVCKRYSISRRTVTNIIKEMRESKRYPKNAIISLPGGTCVLDTAIHDYMSNRIFIKNHSRLEPFRPSAVMQTLQELAL